LENTDITHFLVGNRIPRNFFVTSGIGESDLTVHAGSYHLALKDAGVEMCNIMTYSSILPGIATEITHPRKLTHGSVMESIFSVCNCESGIRATAGVIYGWLYDKSNKKYGGLVCEIFGNDSSITIDRKLHDSLEELYFNGYSDDFELRDRKAIIKSFIPKKKYGTALVALCFTNYDYPILRGFNDKSKLQSNGN
jgi:arginine decarboxylase